MLGLVLTESQFRSQCLLLKRKKKKKKSCAVAHNLDQACLHSAMPRERTFWTQDLVDTRITFTGHFFVFFFYSVRALSSCWGCDNGITTCRLVLLPLYLQQRGPHSATLALDCYTATPSGGARVETSSTKVQNYTSRGWRGSSLTELLLFSFFFTLNPTPNLVHFLLLFPPDLSHHARLI